MKCPTCGKEADEVKYRPYCSAVCRFRGSNHVWWNSEDFPEKLCEFGEIFEKLYRQKYGDATRGDDAPP